MVRFLGSSGTLQQEVYRFASRVWWRCKDEWPLSLDRTALLLLWLSTYRVYSSNSNKGPCKLPRITEQHKLVSSWESKVASVRCLIISLDDHVNSFCDSVGFRGEPCLQGFYKYHLQIIDSDHQISNCRTRYQIHYCALSSSQAHWNCWCKERVSKSIQQRLGGEPSKLSAEMIHIHQAISSLFAVWSLNKLSRNYSAQQSAHQLWRMRNLGICVISYTPATATSTEIWRHQTLDVR